MNEYIEELAHLLEIDESGNLMRVIADFLDDNGLIISKLDGDE